MMNWEIHISSIYFVFWVLSRLILQQIEVDCCLSFVMQFQWRNNMWLTTWWYIFGKNDLNATFQVRLIPLVCISHEFVCFCFCLGFISHLTNKAQSINLMCLLLKDIPRYGVYEEQNTVTASTILCYCVTWKQFRVSPLFEIYCCTYKMVFSLGGFQDAQ